MWPLGWETRKGGGAQAWSGRMSRSPLGRGRSGASFQAWGPPRGRACAWSSLELGSGEVREEEGVEQRVLFGGCGGC